MRFIASRKRSIVCTATLGFLALLFWYFWPDWHLARARELRDRLSSTELSQEERQQLRVEMRQEMRQVTPEKRRDLWRDQGKKRLEAYFALSAREKKAYLDSLIKEMEDRRREWQANASKAGVGEQPAPAPRRSLTQEERDQRRKARLDDSTPEERVMRHEFFHDLQVRRQQLGLPAPTGPGGGRPRGNGAVRGEAVHIFFRAGFADFFVDLPTGFFPGGPFVVRDFIMSSAVS
jgi:hypothetical protein